MTAHPPAWSPSGFTTGDTATVDRHFLRVFIPDDAIGIEGRKHVSPPAPWASHAEGPFFRGLLSGGGRHTLEG